MTVRSADQMIGKRLQQESCKELDNRYVQYGHATCLLIITKHSARLAVTNSNREEV